MAGIPISACIIAKNEERHIENCLKSLLRYDMELIVVDTGSSDSTKKLAERYTDKVYDFAWTDDFSAARNFAASKASNNWIFVLDCDEQVQDMDIGKLRICMQKYPKCVGVLGIMNVYQNNAKEIIRTDEIPRFYNKNYYEYKFRIHEQITPAKAEHYDEILLETFPVPAKVKHYGYDISKEEMNEKQGRNLKLLRRSLGEYEGMDDYVYFQMGQSYKILQEYEQAVEAYDMCLEVNRNPEKRFLPLCLETYTECLMKIGNVNDAYRLLDMNKEYLKTTKLKYLFGKAADICCDKENAVRYLTSITDAADLDKLEDDAFDAFARIFALYKEAGETEKLEEYKNKLVEYGKQHGKQIVFPA